MNLALYRISHSRGNLAEATRQGGGKAPAGYMDEALWFCSEADRHRQASLLFAGSARAGETWAVLASLVNSARLNGFHPDTWLADVLEQIVSGSIPVNRLDELLPWNWKADREARCQLERVAA